MMADEDPTDDDTKFDSSEIPDRSKSDIENVFKYRNISNKCAVCKAEKWYYITDEKALRYGYINLNDGKENPYGISYYVRSCLNCGNVHQIGRVTIDLALKEMSSSGEKE